MTPTVPTFFLDDGTGLEFLISDVLGLNLHIFQQTANVADWCFVQRDMKNHFLVFNIGSYKRSSIFL